MITLSLMAKHYDLIFDESQPTYLLNLRKNVVNQLLPLMNSWEKSGAEPFMMNDVFEPLVYAASKCPKAAGLARP